MKEKPEISAETLSLKVAVLKTCGVPEELSNLLIAGGMYLEGQGGIPLSDYWLSPTTVNMRDEFFVVANTYLAVARIIPKLKCNHAWAEAFHVAFLLHMKANMQAINSLDSLCSMRCYGDAFSVIRSMHSRVNLLLLSALNPYLFNEWMRNPKDPKFLDGKVREILLNNNINTMDHMYEHYSEIIHGQFQALVDVGYMTGGIFPDLPAIMNQAYVSAKYLLAIAGYSLVVMSSADLGESNLPEKMKQAVILYDKMEDYIFAIGRLEHLQTVFAEQRHWVSVGKDKVIAGTAYSPSQLRDQIEKFHREKQPKTLRKPYDTQMRKIDRPA